MLVPVWQGCPAAMTTTGTRSKREEEDHMATSSWSATLWSREDWMLMGRHKTTQLRSLRPPWIGTFSLA